MRISSAACVHCPATAAERDWHVALQDALFQLWQACFPDEHTAKPVSDRWKDAGFQGADPTKDFRGGGIFALMNLLYLAQDHPGTFHRLLHKSDGHRSEWEYPFSAAGAPCFC